MKAINCILLSMIFCQFAYAEPRLQCSDFKTQASAQKFYEQAKAAGTNGWKSLDRDGDGRACDCLPGGNGQNCPKTKD